MSTRLRRRLPAGVWALGFVSLFMDVSSEMIHSLLPAFLVTVVGAGTLTVGAIEGIAESTAAFAKMFSGVLSDHFGRRKRLAVLGYGMAALTKPLFPLADSALTVLMARFVDRIGKGIRGAPRDALVRDITPADQRGAAYGLRQSLDTVGAVGGPLLAAGLMILFAGNMRNVFWVAVIPGFLSVAVLVLAVREPDSISPKRSTGPLSGLSWRALPRQLRLLIGVVSLFTLARFSEAFLILRAQDQGWATANLPLTLVLMNVAYGATAYPFGHLSDTVPRRILLFAGCCVLIVSDLCLALVPGWIGVAAGALLWGLHMGLTEGLLSALVADYAPDHLAATAFGVVSFARGVLLLFSSVLAGLLWKEYGAAATFFAGAAFAALTAGTVLLLPARPDTART